MKNKKKLIDAFGVNEYGIINIPIKYSNIQIGRLLYGEIMGCSFCFPHGIETSNSKYTNHQRNWKQYRRQQWKQSYYKLTKNSNED